MNTPKLHRYAGFTSDAAVRLRDDLVKDFKAGETNCERIAGFANVREATAAADSMYGLRCFIENQSWWKRFLLNRLILPTIEQEIERMKVTYQVSEIQCKAKSEAAFNQP